MHVFLYLYYIFASPSIFPVSLASKMSAEDLTSGSEGQSELLDLDQGAVSDDDPLILVEPTETCQVRSKQHPFWVRWICQRPKTMFGMFLLHSKSTFF